MEINQEYFSFIHCKHYLRFDLARRLLKPTMPQMACSISIGPARYPS
jgi:hypothetical protein